MSRQSYFQRLPRSYTYTVRIYYSFRQTFFVKLNTVVNLKDNYLSCADPVFHCGIWTKFFDTLRNNSGNPDSFIDLVLKFKRNPLRPLVLHPLFHKPPVDPTLENPSPQKQKNWPASNPLPSLESHPTNSHAEWK